MLEEMRLEFAEGRSRSRDRAVQTRFADGAVGGSLASLQRGLVFAADTRTNAGIDNVSQFRKLHFWRRTGDRVLVLLTAGNLAVSQSVISIINEQLSPDLPANRPTLMNVSSMYRAALRPLPLPLPLSAVSRRRPIR
jgi:hypothetical protein